MPSGPVGGEQGEEEEKVPGGFVQEYGVEEVELFVAGGPEGKVDVYAPGPVGGRAEGFLVEEVGPLADGLSQGEGGGGDVGPGPEGKVAPPGV